MPTFHQLRTRIAATLRAVADPGEAAAEARTWMEQGLGVQGYWLAVHGAAAVPEADVRRVEGWLVRRMKGEPLAQILGWAPFCGRRFRVTRHVMIPRPHSEAAARLALRWGRELGITSCVDVGTGCGNLAITLALDSPWRVAATELSPRALAVARGNARAMGTAVRFHEGSLLEPLYGAPGLVVANLPYVDPIHVPDMAGDLAYEPEMALVSPGSGTSLNVQVLRQARAKGARACLLEHGPGQGATLLEHARGAGWGHAHIVPDHLGHDHLLQVW